MDTLISLKTLSRFAHVVSQTTRLTLLRSIQNFAYADHIELETNEAG